MRLRDSIMLAAALALGLGLIGYRQLTSAAPVEAPTIACSPMIELDGHYILSCAIEGWSATAIMRREQAIEYVQDGKVSVLIVEKVLQQSLVNAYRERLKKSLKT